MSVEKTLREDLIAAKALIADPRHWAKGINVDAANGRHCAAVACNDFDAARSMYIALHAALPEQRKVTPGAFRVSDIFDFNDDPDTTHADIMALFDRAISSAEGK